MATFPIVNELNNLIYVVHIAHDITNRKKAENVYQELEKGKSLERHLRNKRNRHQQILGSLPHGVIIVDSNNNLEWVSAWFKEITGFNPEEMILKEKVEDHFYDGTDAVSKRRITNPLETIKKS